MEHFLLIFGSSFGYILGSILGPKSVPKWVEGQTNHNFQVYFRNPFFRSLEALQVPLGSLPDPLMLVLGPSKTRKVRFLYLKVSFFVNVVFRCFKALDVLLGIILAPLGPI